MDANFLFEYLLQSQSIILTERLKNRQLEVHRLIFTYTYGACAAVPDTGGRNQLFVYETTKAFKAKAIPKDL